MPPIYVISLARAISRREKMLAQMQTLGANYEIIDAVDGAALAPADYAGQLRQDKFRRKFGRDMLPGEIGCYLSHYRLWQRIVADKTPSALVLEDDAEWDDDLLSVVRDIADMPRRWGIVLLSGKRRKKTAGLLLATVGENRRLIIRNRRKATATGYMISQQGACELLEYCREISAPVDFAYGEWWRSGILFYCVSPSLVRHPAAHSFIGSRAIKNASLPERFAAWLWRRYDRLHCIWQFWQNTTQKARGIYD